MKSSPGAKRTGEGDREAVEGATPDTVLASAPSTILRMVPLARFAGEDQKDTT